MGYLGLLRVPYVARVLAGTLVGRLPTAMAALAVPLALRRAGVGYGFVGIAVGVLAISGAVGAPLLGRLVDRVGQAPVLVPSAVVAGVGLTAVAVAPGRPGVVVAGTALAGAATPPLEPCLRALWPDLVPSGRLESAYALDSASQELIFVGGPLAVAACVAFASPSAALELAALLGGLGVLTVATAPPARRWRAGERSADWLGALRSPGLVVLFTGLAGAGVALGALNVLAVSYAEHYALPGGAAALLALNACGAMIGALGYGALADRRPERSAPLPRRALLLATGLACGYALLCTVPAPPLMAGLMLLTGLFLAPVLTVSFTLVGRLAPPGTVTEAFAWLVTLLTVGSAVGSAAAGAALAHAGRPWAAACGALGVASGVLVLAAGQRWLREP